MARKFTIAASQAIIIFVFLVSSFAAAQHSSTDLDPKLAEHVKLASELSSRARANVYFTNPQDIFRGVQCNYVIVGLGNLTFLRRDLVASGLIPVVLARVYDSSALGGSDFGPGWMLSAVETISVENHTAKLLSENGSVVEFSEAGEGTFNLSKDRPSDYLALRKVGNTFRLKLRTGFTKEFTLIGERFLLTRVTDRNGNEVRLTYKDDKLSRVEHANHFIEVKRNDQGRIAAVQDDQARKVSYRYDAKGRLIEADDLGGAAWLYSYTEDNRLKTATDPMKRLNFEVAYDDAGRVRRLRQPSGVIQYSYDSSNHATTVTDRKQLVSRYFQNEEGITVRIVNPLGEETAIRLDSARNVTSLSRNGNIVQSMEYDNDHRITSRHAVTTTGGVDVTYKYDSTTGALTGINAGSSSRTFGYDESGNLSTAITDDGLHRYGFSASGDLTAYSTKGIDLTFTPDVDGLIASIKDAKDNTALAYHPGGELATISFADGSKAKYEYQPSGLRAKLTYTDGRQIRYTYDPAGNLLSTEIFDAKGKQIQGQKLTLNDSYQVIKRVLFDGTDESFEYDANGNLTKHTKNGAVTKFEYDELNRLVAVLTPTGERLTYTYGSGERSIVEQYEHSSILVADLIDSGFTFAHGFEVMATRPVTAPFGTVRFSESLGTFQLANATGNEIITPETTVEQALQKLTIVEHTTPLKRRQNLFNRPFNTIFMPAEYASINCCFSCSLANCGPGALAGDGDTSGCCPPCDPPPQNVPSPPSVDIPVANIETDQIQVVLSGGTGTDTLDLELDGPALVVLASVIKGPGAYTFSFLRASGGTGLPLGQYTALRATWFGVSKTIPLSFDVLGMIRHSQYNTPNESACVGAQAKAYITNSSCSFNQTTLRGDFITQTNLNGSGITVNFGTVNREVFCVNQPPAPADSPNRSFRGSGVVAVSCGTNFSATDSTVAVDPALIGSTFQCGDQIILITQDNKVQAKKTVTDTCSACSGGFNGTNGHIDNYTTSPLCSSNQVGDYGNFITIRLR